ncbi:hypothetical protein NKR19_g5421 [Coniochaeta hoffmannii]|uniref:Uncharacterized protein n=1 Tax=Coniochaeta hoffmannii TaxID=91930 RepID=A0AA38VL99_9PEZI|nr:hypothetical protein NKR19_g5421 [Coniochaeta hoffmannii]
MFIPEAQRDRNENTLWRTMQGGIRMLSRRYAMSDLPIGHFEIEIRNTWECFVIGTSYTDADHPAQDRFVRVVLLAREYGLLSRPRRQAEGVEEENEEEGEQAITRGGRIWTDLPFLVDTLREGWKDLMGRDDDTEGVLERRVNLTAAIARLASVGVMKGELGQCGLVVMATALEREGAIAKDTLKLVEVWLRFAGDALLRLSLAGVKADEAWAAGMDGLISPQLLGEGFNKARFIAWKNRLGELKIAATDRETDGMDIVCANMIDNVWDSFYGLH